MADIKFKIQINDTESLEFDNEKILNFRTRTRSTSEPDLPVFNVFASEGTLTIKDDDLSIYAKAEQGIFDNYEYNVDVTLNDVLIAQHKISQRPYYNYSDKTLTIQLGNSIDMFDNLTYEGYSYPGIYTTKSFPVEPQPLSAIFEHIFAKAFNITGTWQEITDEIWTNYFKATNYDDVYDDYLGGSNYGYGVMSKISIDYPYMPSKTFREAFSNVLSRAKLSMVINYDGYFKLVNNQKKTNNIYSGAVIIPNDYISSPFETSVILDNKYDNLQVSAFKTSEKVQTKYLTEEELINEQYLKNPIANDAYKTQKIITRLTELAAGGDTNVNVLGVYTDNAYYFSDYPISVKQYNNLSEILNIQNFKTENIVIMAKYTFERYSCELSVTNLNNSSLRTWKVESIESEPIEKYSNYETLTSHFILTDRTYLGFSDTNSPTAPTITFNLSNYFNESSYSLQEDENGDRYFANNVSFPVGFNVSFFLASENIESPSNSKTSINGYIYKHTYEPISIVVNTYGTQKEIVFNKTDVQLKNNAKNIATVNSCGELLQYKITLTESSEPVKYIEDILDYYANGLHTAKVTVLGGKDYYHDNDSQTLFAKPIFTMGDVLDFKGYDNESIMNYQRSDIPIKWQVVDNELEFEGGACYQNLIVKEIPLYSSKLNYELNADNQTYSVTGKASDETSTNIIIPNIYKGLPVTGIKGDAFRGTNITSINIPNTITSIGASAFENCLNLNEVVINENIKELGDYAFYNTGITKATINSDITSLGQLVFANCENLTTVNIGLKTKTIGYGFFQLCTNLKDVIIENYSDNPSLLEQIGDYAFYKCSSIKQIGFPASLNTIKPYAFNGCTNLSTASFIGGNTGWKINASPIVYLNNSISNATIATYLKTTYYKYTWSKE